MTPSADHLLKQAFRQARPPLLSVALFSLFINLLMLTAPIYMLQIYDRVLVSRSVDTLLLLTAVALGALVIFCILEVLRARVLVRVGSRFDQGLANPLFQTTMRSNTGIQPLRDLEAIRGFLTGTPLLALFDVPWTPIYIALIYVLHPWLGHLALVGAVLLFGVALANDLLIRAPLKRAGGETSLAHQFADSTSRNRDAIEAMGLLPGLTRVWHRWHEAGIAFQALASDRAGFVTGSAKFLRITLQIGILGVGAYLAINETISPGVMIAAAIISSRAMAPVEASISGWRSLLTTREAHDRLRSHLEAHAPTGESMPLPAPKGQVDFNNVYAVPPNGDSPILSNASFRFLPGTSIGLTGPSAAGKSTIARLMVGVWRPASGEVRLDGAELSQWQPEQLGPYIGYLPQDIELFAGNVGQNIARFSELDPATVVEAASLAGAHEMILDLPDGYETYIGPGGENLSGGQKQRIGLARAFYGNPPLVVLDEPTSNLDAAGEASIRNAVNSLKQRGSTVVVIAHKPTLVAGVDFMMVVQKGSITHFGPTKEIMPKITRRVSVETAASGT